MSSAELIHSPAHGAHDEADCQRDLGTVQSFTSGSGHTDVVPVILTRCCVDRVCGTLEIREREDFTAIINSHVF